jgi:hypothetical protein
MNEQMPQSVSPLNYMANMSIAVLEGNHFHIVRDGEDSMMPTCYTDLVVSAEFAALLDRLCPGQLEIFPALIEQIATGETRPGYCVLRQLAPITLKNIDQLDVTGNRVWAYSYNLFVSPAVARALCDAFPGTLEFTDGFSQFAA